MQWKGTIVEFCNRKIGEVLDDFASERDYPTV
jgi:hypothetical protein